MLQYQGGGCSSSSYGFLHNNIVMEEQQQQLMNKKAKDGGDSSSGSGSSWKKTEGASRKHAFAERKRRKRINHHYDSLRQLFPHLPKRDKATVLTEVVRRVKELRKTVANVALDEDQCGGVTTGSSSFFFPGENDEATVSYYNDEAEGKMVKATVCCEDRPGLNRDLAEAVRSVRGKAVRAEMSTIGGRTKVVVLVRWPEGGGGEEEVGGLRRALKVVVEYRALGSTSGLMGSTSGLMGRVLSSSKWAGLGSNFQNGKGSRMVSLMGDGLKDGQCLTQGNWVK